MGYSEGGDDPCSGDTGALLEVPRIVDAAFDEADQVEVGWDYTFCWGVEVEAERLEDPTGAAVPAGPSGLLPLLPGAPTGTYVVSAEVGGSTVEADIEVVAATEPRLFDDPSVQRLPTPGDPTTASDLLLYLVGFGVDTEVPVAVYRGGDGGRSGRSCRPVGRGLGNSTGKKRLLLHQHSADDRSRLLCPWMTRPPSSGQHRG